MVLKRTFGLCLVVITAGMGGAHAQTLQQALRDAYANNPQLAVQYTETRIAREDIRQAESGRRPNAEVTASYTLQRAGTDRFDGFVIPDLTPPDAPPPDPADDDFDPGSSFGNIGIQNIGAAQFRGEQPIYTGGRVRSNVRQAKAGLGAANADLESLRQDVALDTVRAFTSVLRDRQAVSIRQNSVNLLTEQLRATRDRFDVGAVTRTDVALSEAQLEGAKAELALAEAQYQASVADYEFVVGHPPGDLAPAPPLPVYLPETFEAAVALAREQSPDLLSARFAVKAAKAGIGVAKSDLRPTLSIVGTASIQETIGDFRDTNLTAAAQARIPLYQGGLLRSRVRSAQLARNQAEQQVSVRDRQIIVDVSRSWYNYIAAQRAIEASRKQVEASSIAYQGGQDELAAGVRTTLDVLDQEQALLEARLAVVDAERDSYIAAHELLRAMGGLSADIFGLSLQ